MFNITAEPTVAETIGWVLYAVVVLTIFLWPASRKWPASRQPVRQRAGPGQQRRRGLTLQFQDSPYP